MQNQMNEAPKHEVNGKKNARDEGNGSKIKNRVRKRELRIHVKSIFGLICSWILLLCSLLCLIVLFKSDRTRSLDEMLFDSFSYQGMIKSMWYYPIAFLILIVPPIMHFSCFLESDIEPLIEMEPLESLRAPLSIVGNYFLLCNAVVFPSFIVEVICLLLLVAVYIFAILLQMGLFENAKGDPLLVKIYSAVYSIIGVVFVLWFIISIIFFRDWCPELLM